MSFENTPTNRMFSKESLWWKAWWEKDFSWEAMENIVIERTIRKPAKFSTTPHTRENRARLQNETLQDYWRDQKNNLIRSPVSGKRFTRMHLPFYWEDGTPTGKLDWPKDALDAIIENKISQFPNIRIYAEDDLSITTSDERAQFQGSVFIGSCVYGCFVSPLRENFRPKAVFSIVLNDCYFDSDAYFDGSIFISPLEANNCFFAATASFDYVFFEEGIEFCNPYVKSSVSFQNVIVKNEFICENGDFLKGISFSNAIVNGFGMRNTRFSDAADFTNTRFLDYFELDFCDFEGALDCEQSEFHKNADFRSCIFLGDIKFISAIFLEGIDFSKSAFKRNANFANSIFNGPANFNGTAETDRARTVGSADLFECTDKYRVPLQFNEKLFRSINKFEASQAVFLDELHFNNRDILAPSSFRDAVFLKSVYFHGSSLHQGTDFHNANFESIIDQEKVPEIPERVLSRLYSIERQRSDIDIPGINERRRTDFSETGVTKSEIRSHLRLGNIKPVTTPLEPEEIKWRIFLKHENLSKALSIRKYGAKLDLNDKLIFLSLSRRQQAQWRSDLQSLRYAEIEDSFRTLRQAMEASRNKTAENRFFRLEIEARAKRRDKAVPQWERAFAFLYKTTSDYGTSFTIPIFLLFFAVVPIFAMIYFGLSLPTQYLPTTDDLFKAIDFSFSRVIPFWPGRADMPSSAPFVQPPSTTSIILRIIASLQSSIAVALFFLAGLAVRRRFQIS